MRKSFWFSLIVAMATLAGCSSPSPPPARTEIAGGTATAGRLTGTMDDWQDTLCGVVEAGSRLMPSATDRGRCMGRSGTGIYMFGTYPLRSESAISADLAILGPYAEGNTATKSVIFAVGPQENRSLLAPLEQFGFVIHPGNRSACSSDGVQVECPARGGTPTALPTTAPQPLPPAPQSQTPAGPGSSPNSPEARRFLQALDAAQILQLGSVYSPGILSAANRACAQRNSGWDLSRITTSLGQDLRTVGMKWVTGNISGGIVSIAFTQLCPR